MRRHYPRDPEYPVDRMRQGLLTLVHAFSTSAVSHLHEQHTMCLCGRSSSSHLDPASHRAFPREPSHTIRFLPLFFSSDVRTSLELSDNVEAPLGPSCSAAGAELCSDDGKVKSKSSEVSPDWASPPSGL